RSDPARKPRSDQAARLPVKMAASKEGTVRTSLVIPGRSKTETRNPETSVLVSGSRVRVLRPVARNDEDKCPSSCTACSCSGSPRLQWWRRCHSWLIRAFSLHHFLIHRRKLGYSLILSSLPTLIFGKHSGQQLRSPVEWLQSQSPSVPCSLS